MTATTEISEVPTATVGDRRSWDDLLARLSRQSVVKHFDAYADVAWDDPDMAIDRADPRWALGADDPLGATAWYQALPDGRRASLGLDLVASKMKIGLQFEAILKRGLLLFAAQLPNRSPEFRYAYHEIIEEAQHSLMFQEFVNRSGFDARGLGRLDRIGAGFVASLGRRFPPLFFVFVLGGEEPIDHVQRRTLRTETEMHPLLERIMRIHVTEEARHLSFARHYLKREVPAMGAVRRALLGVGTPLILSAMARMMLQPSSQVVAEYAIPSEVIDEAYRHNAGHRAATLESLQKVRNLCGELGLLDGPYRAIWKVLGIWQ
jgi:hypothetical protein